MTPWLRSFLKMLIAMVGILVTGITVCVGIATLTISIFGIESVVVKIVGMILLLPALLTFLGAVATTTMIHNSSLDESAKIKKRTDRWT